METMDAFLKGIKPAYLVTHMYEMDIVNQLKDRDYPYYFDDHEFGGSSIFFQTEDMKNQYITEMINVDFREDILITGKFLGFPPVACEFFADVYDNPELEVKRAAFHYYGHRFAGNVDNAEVIARWLWENVQAPIAAVEMEYNRKVKWIEPSVVVTT
jgi:hypothetical protein